MDCHYEEVGNFNADKAAIGLVQLVQKAVKEDEQDKQEDKMSK